MQRFVLALVLLPATAAMAQVNPFYLWELAPAITDLSAQPSDTDLVNGFPEGANSLLSDEIMNESIFPLNFGIPDPINNVESFLMDTNPGGCIDIINQPSDGLLGLPGNELTDLNDGQLGIAIEAVLRDFGRAALVVRFGFSTPTDIGVLRVIGGNLLNRDVRVFHHYDVWASTDGLGDLGDFALVAQGVQTGEFLAINSDIWEGSLTELHNFDSKYLVEGATDFRIVFYCVGNTEGRFQDPWQGLSNEDPAFVSACEGTEEDEDTDGVRRAFVGPIIKEIDVFAPSDPTDLDGITPWGDIDYDGDRDLVDIASMQQCPPSITLNGCFRFDPDDDTDIDGADVDLIEPYMMGPIEA